MDWIKLEKILITGLGLALLLLSASQLVTYARTASADISNQATQTVVTPNPSSVMIAKTINFTGTVTDTSITPTVPTGTISWKDGGAGGTFTVNGISTNKCTLSSVSSSASACKATYKATSSAGFVTINATYSGDSAHQTSSGTSKLKVYRTSSTAISPSKASVVGGGKQLYNATVTDTSPGTKSPPGGTVSWKASLPGGSFSSGTCTLAPISSSQSKCHVTFTAPMAAGNDTITGTYGGDSMHAKSSGKAVLSISTLVAMTLSPGTCINGSPPCYFNPENVAIPIGGTVTWKNIDSVDHAPTSNTPLFSSDVPPGQTYSFKFTSSGTINYHCAIHPFMTGVVKVS